MSLQAENLSFAYSQGKLILDSVTISLRPGTVTAIAGPNGAGKSTLLRVLLGLVGGLRPGSGQVLLDGRPLRSFSHRERARRLAYVPQQTSLAFGFSVREYVRLGRFATGAADDDRVVSVAMERADIADRADDPFFVLSAGQQQRATLARALAQLEVGGDAPPTPASQVLLADEPVSAMDPRHALLTMEILRELAAGGRTVAVVLHDLTLAARFCDEAILLDQQGRLAASGPGSEALAPAILENVFQVAFVQMTAPDGAPVLVPEAKGRVGSKVGGEVGGDRC